MITTIRGQAYGKLATVVGNNIVAVGGYSPTGYDNSKRHTIAERHNLGCTQVTVQRSESGQMWVATEVTTGEQYKGGCDVWTADDFAAYAAAVMAGEYSI